MIKQSFLDSLVGKEVTEAKQLCEQYGHNVHDYPEGTIICSLAYGNTVMLYYNNSIVVSACAGDPCEVVYG